MLNITITPQHSARLDGHENELYALVRVTSSDELSADLEQSAKPPLNVSLVIDQSGSMQGAPIEAAKGAAAHIVQNLRRKDRLSVVTYADQAHVIIPGQQAEDRHTMLDAINRIRPGGCTALHDGWLAGAEQAALMRQPGETARVILLSDGCANRGEMRVDFLSHDAARMAENGITTTTCGLGQHFDEFLMLSMARAGQGSAYYGERAEDIIEPFHEELLLLENLIAKRLRLSLVPGDGVELTLFNDYQQQNMRYILPDLAAGGEAWALVKLKFAETDHPEHNRLLLTSDINFESIEGEQLQAGPARLRLPKLPANAFAALAQNETVTARRQELRAAKLQDMARTAARQRNWPAVERLINQARKEAGDNEWVEKSLRALERISRQRDVERFSKESAFMAQKMRSRLAPQNDANPREWSQDSQASLPSFLRKKPIQGRNFDDNENSETPTQKEFENKKEKDPWGSREAWKRNSNLKKPNDQ